MAVAKVSWEDSIGAARTLSARIEDTSKSGACIRMSAYINVGTRLNVSWREGQFSGTAKYCRPEGRDYVIGIQRTVPKAAKGDTKSNSDAWRSTNREIPAPKEATEGQSPSHEERTPMLGKWLHLASGRDSQNPQITAGVNSKLTSGSTNGKHPEAAPTAASPAKPSFKDQIALLGDLLPFDDIYRATGIVSLRSGYSINKVVEMLNSDHIRELPSEMKRASVLMALDVAGIPVEDVLKDGKLRLSALDSYEVDQKKHLEEFEALKIQENTNIQKEMDRMTTHFQDRLQHNLDEIALVRQPLHSWQTMKQQEVQRISEALKLCVNQMASESPNHALPKTREIVDATKAPESVSKS